MSVTRRQFALWSAAALLISRSASASKGESAPERVGLAALDFELKPAKASDHELAFDVYVTNHGAKGLTTTVRVMDANVKIGETSEQVMGWMNDDNPMSRRIVAPSFVDIPADKRLLVGQAHFAIPPKDRQRAGAALHIELSVGDGEDYRRISLPPVVLAPEPENT